MVCTRPHALDTIHPTHPKNPAPWSLPRALFFFACSLLGEHHDRLLDVAVARL